MSESVYTAGCIYEYFTNKFLKQQKKSFFHAICQIDSWRQTKNFLEKSNDHNNN
jgi:hypothetical protein